MEDFNVTSITSLQPGAIFAPVGPESALAYEVCRLLRKVWGRDKCEAGEVFPSFAK